MMGLSEVPHKLIAKLRPFFFAKDRDIALGSGRDVIFSGGGDISGVDDINGVDFDSLVGDVAALQAAPYVTHSTSSTLSNERVLTAGTSITLDTSTPGQVVINAGFTAGGEVPIGGIIMWSGAVAAIPSNWALCDGNNGTPNLTDRFVIGAGNTYSPGVTGGAATVDLQHNHDSGTLGTNSAGSHTHGNGSLATDSDSHTHGPGTLATDFSPSITNIPTGGANTLALTHNHTVNSGVTGSDSHSHNVTGSTASDGSHSHNVNSGNTGNALSTTQSILPPYYALAFIMRTV